MIVDLFIPCFIDQLFPETAFNTLKILKQVDVEVNYNTNQTCCGQPAFNSGFRDEAKTVSEKLISDFPYDRYIVTPSGSCCGFMRNNMAQMFEGTEHSKQAETISERVFELSEFLIDVLGFEDLNAEFKGKAVYHHACGALRECGIKSAPLQLLNKVRGLELLELKEEETCCGFGGSFSVKFEPISVGMADAKVQNALAAGAEYIISSDASCLMHLNGYIEANNLPLKTVHLSDVLTSGWK